MKTKNALIVFIFSFLFLDVSAQKQGRAKIDSLYTVLNSPVESRAIVKALIELSSEFNNINLDSAMEFANKAYLVAARLKDDQGIGDAYLWKGYTKINRGKYDDAFKDLEESLAIFQKIGEQKSIAKAYYNLGIVYMEMGNYTESLQHLNISLKLMKEIGSKIGIANSYQGIGNVYRRQANYTEAINNYFNSLKVREEIGERKGVASSFVTIGSIYHLQGNYKEALNNYFSAIKIREEIQDKRGMANVYNNIGILYMDQGNYPESLKNHLIALKIREENKDNRGVFGSYINIGEVYRMQENYTVALKYYYEALKIQELINDKANIAVTYNNIGSVFYAQRNYSEALKNYSDAFKIFEGSGNKNGLAKSYNNIGSIFINQANDLIEGLRNFFAALKIQEEIGDKQGIAMTCNNIGAVYTNQKKYLEASTYFNRSLTISLGIGSLDDIKECYKGLAKLDSAQGNFKQALENYKLYITYRDSLFNDENTKKLVQSQMQYEFDKKEAITKVEYDKQIAIAEADKLRGIAIADKKRVLIEADKKLALVEADKKLTQSEAQKKIAIADAERKRLVAVAEKKRTEAEAEKQITDVKAENEKQKLLRNAIAGGAGIISLSALLSFVFYKRKRDAEQLQKETALNLQVSETEMKALRSQMNPHFIFNALQSIQTFLMSHQSEEANTYLLKFSKLMRAVLENSQHREISLKKDMQALELYMQLESIRLPYPFTYEFHIDETIDVEETTIPPLILQPFVENAIWHGLQYKPEPGHINIYVSKIDNALHAIVEDNGVGRDMRKKVGQPMLLKRESLGMKLTEERLKVLNDVKNFNARFTITDLFSKNNQPSGTKVELLLPIVA